MKRALLFVAVLATASGCFEQATQTPEEFTAYGSLARFAYGWAYDGVGARNLTQGDVSLALIDETNMGLVVSHVDTFGVATVVRIEEFYEAPNKTFQNGGVARDLEEHGDSGQGDTSIPRVHAAAAAWGNATITMNGTAFRDMVTGGPKWQGHVMVLTTGVRNDSTNAIYTDKSHTAFYDPKNAAKGEADPNDLEVHLVVRTNQPPPQNATPVDAHSQAPITDPNYAETVPLFDNKYWGTTATLTFTVTAEPVLGANSFRADIRGPTNESVAVLAVGQVGPGALNQTATTSQTVTLMRNGNYTAYMSGKGVNGQWRLNGTLTPPKEVVLNYWFENVTIGNVIVANQSSSPGVSGGASNPPSAVPARPGHAAAR